MRLKKLIDSIKLFGLALPFPVISDATPWSGETLMHGKPIVTLTELKPFKVFIGVKTWSCYMPITTSYLSFFLTNNESAENGPDIFIFFFFK